MSITHNHFSIIIDNYNYGRYLDQCIQSCLHQDYPSDCFEIIVVDDGSTDSSREVIEKYSQYENFKIIFQDNYGQAAAIARGLQEASNELICLLDSDDYYLPDKLKRLNKEINRVDLKGDFLLCHDFKIWVEEYNKFSKKSWFQQINLSSNYESLSIDQVAHPAPFSNPCGLVINLSMARQIAESMPTFDWKQGADGVLVQAALLITGRVHYFNDLLAVYRVHGENAFFTYEVSTDSLKPNFDWRLKRRPKMLCFLERFLNILNFSPEQKNKRISYLKNLEALDKITTQQIFEPQPKVSYLITNYNYSAYLPQAVSSIENQVHNNYEIIIVDDCSTDSSKQVIESLAKRNPKIKTLYNTQNLGQLGAIAAGYKEVEGSYLVLVDADDTLDTCFTERHLYVHRFLSLCMVTSCDIRFVDTNGVLIHDKCYLSSGSWTQTLQYFSPFSFTLRDWVFAPCTANMFRKTKMLDLLFCSLTPKIINAFKKKGDWLLLYYANMLGGNTRVNECLVNFRLHEQNNDTHLHFPSKYIKALNSGDPDYATTIELFMSMLITHYEEFKQYYSIVGLQTYINWLLKEDKQIVQSCFNKLSSKLPVDLASIYSAVVQRANINKINKSTF